MLLALRPKCCRLDSCYGDYGDAIMNQQKTNSMRPVLLGLLLMAAPAAMQGQYDYTTNSDGISITITGYIGAGGAVTIPTNITNLTVTSIGEGAFEEITNLTSVTIPGSVTSLGDGSFALCFGLTTVEVPGSITNIGENTFRGCTNLSSLTLFSGVTSIGGYAFFDCISLTNVTIPDSVTNIASYAFFSCNNLTSVTIPGTVGSGYDLLDVFGSYATNFTIDNGVTSIASNLFYGTIITSVRMPASATSIGSYAFDACHYLTNLIIPAGVTNIGANAFINCGSLTGIFFWGNAPAYGSPLFNGANHTNYYLPGATGWSNTFAGDPAVLWNPSMQTSGPGLGVQGNQFGFNIAGTSNIPIVVEACTNLASPVWAPLQTNTLTNGSFNFSEPVQTSGSGRYYRISSP